MSSDAAKGISVTVTPIFDGRFLFVQRNASDAVLGGYWCFPGGKVHVGETLAAAVRRELAEETGLTPTGRAFFVDSYLLGDRVGAHFAVEVARRCCVARATGFPMGSCHQRTRTIYATHPGHRQPLGIYRTALGNSRRARLAIAG